MREDQYNVTVTIDGINYGTWDKLSGGELDSEESKYRPGNLQPQISLGGSKTPGNVTVSRLYDLARDHNSLGDLLNAVGRADVVVSKQPLDVNGAPFGTPVVYTGKLKQLTPPDVDSESSDAALIELEISVASIVKQ